MGDLPFLKSVSRAKHEILTGYLRPWSVILGSTHREILYVDCFAGGGEYAGDDNQTLVGSPIIAWNVARQFEKSGSNRRLLLKFVEREHEVAERLRLTLRKHGVVDDGISDMVEEMDANQFVEELIGRAEAIKTQLIPTFFFIDPYGHPNSLSAIRKLLDLGQTEILVNLMWFRISMDLNNPKSKKRIDHLFGHEKWKTQKFMGLASYAREKSFVDYLVAQVGARYNIRFRVTFDPEDGVSGGAHRTKFYLLHLSNHPKAALLMKQVMGGISDSLHTLKFGGSWPRVQNEFRMNIDPSESNLKSELKTLFGGRRLGFDAIMLETLNWPYFEKDYRAALLSMAADNNVIIKRIDSKKTGLRGRDELIFM